MMIATVSPPGNVIVVGQKYYTHFCLERTWYKLQNSNSFYPVLRNIHRTFRIWICFKIKEAYHLPWKYINLHLWTLLPADWAGNSTIYVLSLRWLYIAFMCDNALSILCSLKYVCVFQNFLMTHPFIINKWNCGIWNISISVCYRSLSDPKFSFQLLLLM